MQLIADTISKVKVGEAKTFKNLTVFPILGAVGAAADYITLDEALAEKVASVTEVDESGSVPELKFTNSSDSRVFLLDGEELIGAKQNRVLNLSILVPAGKTIVIPVSCVESGRWHHRSREFASAPRAHYAAGRAEKMSQVSASLRSSGLRTSDQAEVWQNISNKFSRFRASSATSAMSDIYEQRSGRLEKYLSSFSTVEGQVGAMFAIDGKIIGFDLFDCPDTLGKLFPKLLRSYGLDALDRAISAPKAAERASPPGQLEAEAFLEAAAKTQGEEFPAVGEGRDLRLKTPGLAGAALESNERIVHLCAFAVSVEPSQQPV
jgi:hypothetical protein